MEPIDYWKLCHQFTVIQAALLIVGVLPDEAQYEVEGNNYKTRVPKGYVPVKAALLAAINSEELRATVVWDQSEFDEDRSINLYQTMIHGRDLYAFIKARGMASPFFDSFGPSDADDLDSSKSSYPPKLDAALKAWRAVTDDPGLLRGKSPKQAIGAWLFEHAEELRLLNKDGSPNRHGIEEVCKVVNWKPEGGATPTPGAVSTVKRAAGSVLTLPDPRRWTNPRAKGPVKETFELDDEIPF